MDIAFSIFLILVWVCCGLWAAYLARLRNRDEVLWAIVGVLAGLIGVFAIAVLPPKRGSKAGWKI